MKKRQYISLLFLFSIVLVLAHGIIPHHHYDESCLTEHRHNHLPEGNQPEKPLKDPWHCQPYAHIVLVDLQLLNKFKAITIEEPEFLGNLVLLFFMPMELVFLSPYHLTDLFVSQPFLTACLLRAPPI